MRKGETMSIAQRQLRSERMTGAGNHQWRGGRRQLPGGYIATGKRGLEHRVVMSHRIGRDLGPKEQVHHVNEVRSDNRPENLRLFADCASHRQWHAIVSDNGELLRAMAPVSLR